MKILKKIALRFIIFLGLLIGLNIFYIFFFLENDLQKHSPIINQVRAVPQDTEVLYIGESSNNTAASIDIDKRAISDFLADHYPSLNFADITKPASHSGIYKTLLRHLEHAPKIKTVIVTLNMRSFNAEWINSGLEIPLRKSMLLLQNRPPLFNRFMLSFKGYPITTEKERWKRIKKDWMESKLHLPHPFTYPTTFDWRTHIEEAGVNDENGIRNEKLTNLVRDYVSTYAFELDLKTNPRIKDFNAIIKLAKKNNWNLVFNLLAENIEKAELLGGKPLSYLMRENRDKLVHYFTDKGVTVVDNLEALPDEQFIDKDWPTEHYFEMGRKIIGKNVANAIQKFHPEAYSPKNYQIIFQSHFHNDCEGETTWSRMETTTDEQAFSGKFSSKTDAENEFSLSFEFPFTNIPDSTKNSIEISMMLKAEVIEETVAFVVDIRGEKIERYWASCSLKPMALETNGWQRIHHLFILPDRVLDGEIISIYLLNSSGEPIYVDDIDILFQ